MFLQKEDKTIRDLQNRSKQIKVYPDKIFSYLHNIYAELGSKAFSSAEYRTGMPGDIGNKGTFGPSNIYRFDLATSYGLLIKLYNNGANSVIKCKLIVSTHEFEFNECTVSIKPKSTKDEININLKYHFKLNKKLRIEFSGEAIYTHRENSEGTQFTFKIFNSIIEFQGYTQSCQISNMNIQQIYSGHNIIYPCQSNADRSHSDIATREVSDPSGICCCIKGKDVDNTNAEVKYQCEYILYANDCASTSPNQCFPKVLSEMLKSAQCKACIQQF
ncbi:hypothetical protein RF11_16036 [Thelohanellus kitauei]|uniref:Uncharacterized protein n=1 Tax=Thelohanellus kitauei TaxID=669202 RepID=A0A0C2JBK9_THEKT|nr:hypothetical protein RF11_16036 [Thelohanellus kitauei]